MADNSELVPIVRLALLQHGCCPVGAAVVHNDDLKLPAQGLEQGVNFVDKAADGRRVIVRRKNSRDAFELVHCLTPALFKTPLRLT
jgi:hypothetical protein